MARTAWPTVLSGDSWSASQHNTYGRDNDLAYWVYTTAGDMAYATASNALARLAIGSANSLLRSNGSAPVWTAPSSVNFVPGLLHAKAVADFNAGDQVISATSYTDITNATVNIVTTRTCTILMVGVGTFAAGGSGQRTLVQGVIGGTGSGDTVDTSITVYVPYTVVYYRTGIAAGTITCKLQGKGNSGGNSGIFRIGRISAFAFVES